MSNQEPQKQNMASKETAVQKRRRFIKGAGVATPVILTLSSPSVFGALCLSQQMSGNVSGTTGSCVLGLSPGFWATPTPQGSTTTRTLQANNTIAAWTTAGFDYGTYNTGNKSQCGSYTGGTAFNDPLAFGPGVGGPYGTSSLPMREILCTQNGSALAHLVCALLNAKYQKGTYVLSPAQVIGLWNGSILPPGGNLNTYLDSTWA